MSLQDFNRQFPVGTEVIRYRLVNPLRDPVRTRIRSEAWLMGGVMIVSIQALPTMAELAVET